jgi:hypothetical protein
VLFVVPELLLVVGLRLGLGLRPLVLVALLDAPEPLGLLPAVVLRLVAPAPLPAPVPVLLGAGLLLLGPAPLLLLVLLAFFGEGPGATPLLLLLRWVVFLAGAPPLLLLLLLLLLWVVFLPGLGDGLGAAGRPATGLPLAMLLRLVAPAVSSWTPSACFSSAELRARMAAQLLAPLLLVRLVRPPPLGQMRVGSMGAMVGASPQVPKLYRSNVGSTPMRYIVQPGMVWFRRMSRAYMPSHWVCDRPGPQRSPNQTTCVRPTLLL